MSVPVLDYFVYAEQLDPALRRSLGYGLLRPLEPKPWKAEVETIARRLQAAKYPDYWPKVDLFCSLLLETGERVVACARYGRNDNTPSHRKGGLEFLGVVIPAKVSPADAIRVYEGIKLQIEAHKSLSEWQGGLPFLEEGNPAKHDPKRGQPGLPLPIGVWRRNFVLFTGGAPGEPDSMLALLNSIESPNWQWIPYVGIDFPLDEYAKRGSLFAWTLPAAESIKRRMFARRDAHAKSGSDGGIRANRIVRMTLILLLCTNLLTAVAMVKGMAQSPPKSTAEMKQGEPSPKLNVQVPKSELGRSLYTLLFKHRVFDEWTKAELSQRYDKISRSDKGLNTSDEDVKRTISAIQLLSRRRADRLQEIVVEALSNKGYDPELIRLINKRISEKLRQDVGDVDPVERNSRI